MLKARQEPCEHRLGGVAQVVAELKLAEVLRKMLPADMDMRAPDRAFDLRPKPFDGIGMMDTVYPLVRRVVDGAVVITEPCDLAVRRKLVSADGRATLDVLNDVPLQGRAPYIRHNPGHYVAATLDHSEHHRLARRATPALTARVPTADVGFIGFDMPIQRGIAVNRAHVLANLMRMRQAVL